MIQKLIGFFQQKDWIKTLMSDTPSTCYGADNYVSSTITIKMYHQTL